MGPKPRPVVERFWDKVTKGAPDECWLWRASGLPKGYGTTYFEVETERAPLVVGRRYDTASLPSAAQIAAEDAAWNAVMDRHTVALGVLYSELTQRMKTAPVLTLDDFLKRM